ncbi:DUF938 domain-containing protein [Shewanella sp. WXL01]|uniref:DUF938 domain-containing protein n=1 Tax=Shewanella sp. WXL01 TaxID=2709721 RepID=UPI0014383FBA|nr:DUF938 domain-containing protein [Shewanella sp. WXL01]NKF51554.1 DUF938 domain-containing protein [Shewanella sp. WXL01]
MFNELPFSQACENNKQPILEQLTKWLVNEQCVLEIGSGTGQHSVYFSELLSHIRWQPSDQQIYLDNIKRRVELAKLNNLQFPVALDVTKPWPTLNEQVHSVFTANTLHIMSKTMVEALFSGLGTLLEQSGSQLIIYGPFNYQGKYTSESNANFDAWLAEQDPQRGIRDIEWVTQLASAQGFSLVDDVSMPANNRLLRFIRQTSK